MRIIADTNTFLAVALNEPEKEQVIELTEGADIVAPEVLPFEIGNALSAMARRNILNDEEVLTAWESIQNIPVELCTVDIPAALSIALEFNLYAYDAYFLSTAVRYRSPLLTLDRAMQRVAKELGIAVLE